MISLLAKVVPLDLAATLSPGILALAVILLGGKHYPRVRTAALFFGTLLVAVGIALAGYSLGEAAPTGIKQNLTSAIIDLVFGIIFVAFGIKQLYAKERKISSLQERPKSQFFKWLAVGVLVSVTNFDALFLSLAAAKEVGGADVSSASKFIILVVNILFLTSPVLLPLVMYLIFPEFAGRVLTKINHYVLKYSKYILFILFLIFGLLLVTRGIEYFY